MTERFRLAWAALCGRSVEVPPILLGMSAHLDEATYANYEAAHRKFVMDISHGDD